MVVVGIWFVPSVTMVMALRRANNWNRYEFLNPGMGLWVMSDNVGNSLNSCGHAHKSKNN